MFGASRIPCATRSASSLLQNNLQWKQISRVAGREISALQPRHLLPQTQFTVASYHSTPAWLKKRKKQHNIFKFKFVDEDYCRKHAWLLDYTNDMIHYKLDASQRRQLVSKLGVQNTKTNMKLLKQIRNKIKERMPEEDTNGAGRNGDGLTHEDLLARDLKDVEEEDTPLIYAVNMPHNSMYDFVDEEYAAENSWLLEYTNKKMNALKEEELDELIARLNLEAQGVYIPKRKRDLILKIRRFIKARRPKELKDMEFLNEEQQAFYHENEHAQIKHFAHLLGIQKKGKKPELVKRVLKVLNRKVHEREWNLLLQHEKKIGRWCRMFGMEKDVCGMALFRRLDRVSRQNRFLLSKMWENDLQNINPEAPGPSLEEFDELHWEEQVLYFRNHKDTIKLLTQKLIPNGQVHISGAWKVKKYFAPLLQHFGLSKTEQRKL